MSITSSGGEVTDALNGKLTFEQSKNRIIGRDEDNLPRLLISANSGDFSMKVSKPGDDALTTPDADLLFNSNQNIFKVVQTGTISGTKAAFATSATFTDSHSLGYTPAVMAFIPVGSGEYIPTPFQQHTTAGLLLEEISCHVSSTQVKLKMFSPNTAGNPFYEIARSMSIKYYLFTETAA